MWEDILKRKKMDFSFLKQISIKLAEKFKGRTLVRDEFLDFLESIEEIYFDKYPHLKTRRGKRLESFRKVVPRILKNRGILEVKTRPSGPEEYYRTERIYIFKE